MRSQQIVLKFVHLRLLIRKCHFKQIFLRGNGLFPHRRLREMFLLPSDIILKLSDLVLTEVNLPLQLVQLILNLVLHHFLFVFDLFKPTIQSFDVVFCIQTLFVSRSVLVVSLLHFKLMRRIFLY